MFDLYKPFRNKLRKVSLVGSLHSVYRFFQFLDFEIELPAALAPPAWLMLRNRLRWGIHQWEFEILARELILNADEHSSAHLDTWSAVATQINAIKTLENNTWALHSKADDDVLYELVRMSHRQFPWQRGLTHSHILRYSRLYEEEGVAELILGEYGMTYAEMAQLGLALSGHFKNNFYLTLPVANKTNDVPAETCEKFIDRFSLPLPDLRKRYRDVQSFDINWAYTFNPLRGHPLVRLQNGKAICPIPSFLIRRLTSEIYYDLVPKAGQFSSSFGPAVQALIGEVALRSDIRARFTLIPEARYGPGAKPRDTIDWILEDATGVLFIECKEARTRFRGTSDLSDRSYIDGEFDRMRGFALQVYRTLADALQGNYPNWKPSGKPVYPIIVTLEDWETFGLHVDRLIVDPLRQDLDKLGIDPGIVDQHPLSFCAVDTFEQAMAVCNSVGIAEVFGRKTRGEYPQWALETFLLTNFGAELGAITGSVFADQWERLRPSSAPRIPLRGRKRRGAS